jgi:hypothetical protein
VFIFAPGRPLGSLEDFENDPLTQPRIESIVGLKRQEMNPEEFSRMNQFEQVLELSFLAPQGVGDEHDSDMVMWNLPIEGDPEQNPYDNDWENEDD